MRWRSQLHQKFNIRNGSSKFQINWLEMGEMGNLDGTYLLIYVNNITTGFDLYLMNPLHLCHPMSKLNGEDFYSVSTKSNSTTRIGISLTIEQHKDKTEAKCSASMKSSQYRGTSHHVCNNDGSL